MHISLAGLTLLQKVHLDSNQIVDIDALAGLTVLNTLRLSYNQITDITPLVNNGGIDSGDEVHLQGNPLDDNSMDNLIPLLLGRGVNVEF